MESGADFITGTLSGNGLLSWWRLGKKYNLIERSPIYVSVIGRQILKATEGLLVFCLKLEGFHCAFPEVVIPQIVVEDGKE